MRPENKAVHALWVGKYLSSMELLTVHSFINCGHEFNLWVYGPLKTPLPKEVVFRDANEIIPEDQIFTYKKKNEFGHGKGSYAGFSDVFRLKLLYEVGGWYVDMDVTCLKPLDFEEPYVFRAHPQLKLVDNVIKCPPKSDLMRDSYAQASQEINAYTGWLAPNKIVNHFVEQYGLEKYIRADISNQDNWPELVPFIQESVSIPPNYYCIHWVNEEWRSRELSKDRFRKHSRLHILMKENGVPVKPLKWEKVVRLKEDVENPTYKIGKLKFFRLVLREYLQDFISAPFWLVLRIFFVRVK